MPGVTDPAKIDLIGIASGAAYNSDSVHGQGGMRRDVRA